MNQVNQVNQVDQVDQGCTLRDGAADEALGLPAFGARYGYDTKLLARGWEQYDTDQDAWYFGVWVDVEGRQIFSHAEGDRTLQRFATAESFAAELRRMAGVYGDAPPFASVIEGDGTLTSLVAPRPGDALFADQTTLPQAA